MEEDSNYEVDASPTLESMKGRLKKASPQSVRLFFVKRDKKKQKKEKKRPRDQNLKSKKENNNPGNGDIEITYEVLQTEITPDIGLVLKKIARNKMNALLEIDGLCLHEYDPGVVTDQSVVEQIDANKVDHLSTIYKDMKSLDLNSYSIKKNEVPWAMAVHVRSAGLVLFRKFTQGRILENAGLVPFFIEDGVFTRLKKPALTVDREIDCIYDIQEKRIYIFNRDQFEAIFSFAEVVMERVESKKVNLARLNLVDDTDLLAKLSKNDPKKVRKLYSILESETLNKITPQKLKNVCSDYVLSLEFNGSNQVVVKKKDLWQILRALDDAYLLSTSTRVRYDVYSKEALPRMNIISPPSPQAIGTLVTIDGNVINADTITWNWGDDSKPGTMSYPRFFPVHHSYSAAKEYTVKACAEGKYGSIEKEIEIEIVEATITSTATQSVLP
ncbi:MAG: DUF4868 domain-containing protein [Theionarchaea archaeon]|nr:DUF4868 domain-containing protein [Theionarchaea archaeon]